MANELQKLKSLLSELFQLDAEDLDFGMYRVLRLRRDELVNFLEHTLTEEVGKALGAVAEGERAGIETRMAVIAGEAAKYKARPEDNEEYIQLRTQLAEASETSARERQVYAHLGEFFSRYYEDGDFLSLPRLKGDTYAVPYDGSEVVLHWANKDQYYVKSGEYFARYAFQLGDRRRVVFRLVDAATDPDNVKAADAGKRRFRLVDGDGAVAVENGELVCRFVYETAEGKQDAVNEATEGRVVGAAPREWVHGLKAAKGERTLLGWHLRQYTEKNKRDYFIHKDLGGFLRRELDHYLKTEVFDLDTVEAISPDDVSRALTMVKTIRAVAKPVVTFLASIEDFQKRLFLKKKMVLRTDWCVTLDRVPEEFYGEIGVNQEQVKRWKELFAIQEIEALPLVPGGDGKGATVTAAFLKRNRGLVVETRLFSAGFTARLLAALGNWVDSQVTGVMVRGENLQALCALDGRLEAAVSHVFIDPPYNTGDDRFPYKDGYQHSSWLAMMRDRLRAVRTLVYQAGLLAVTTDYVEVAHLRLLMESVFGPDTFLADVAWEKRYTRSNNAKKFYSLKDTVMTFAVSAAMAHVKEARTQKSKEGYTNPDGDSRGPWLSSSYVNPATKEARPRLAYDIENPVSGMIVRHPTHAWKYEWATHVRHAAEHRLYWGETGEYEYPRLKNFLAEASEDMVPVDLWTHKYAGSTDDGGNVLKAMFGSEVFDNPKPPMLVQRFLELRANQRACTHALDFFAGSGTTGHAVLNLNREDQGNRKFILVEVNDYFDTVLVPRILKATYSKEWKEGRPVDRAPVPGGALYKVLTLESYEDTLANVALPAPPSDSQLPLRLKREYTVRYMLDQETRVAVMDLDRFRRPFRFTMEVRRGGLVTPDHPVDLVETFNYLIGLHVSRYGFFKAADHIRYVEGTVQDEGNKHRVLVLWRDCEAVPDDELVRLFEDREFAPVSSREYDRIYVNGDPPLANLKRPDEQWKVLAIEDEFKRLSFAGDVDG